jgi:DNA repair exonuclease SbcCD ATPase subunit
LINISKISWQNFLGYENYTTSVDFDDYKGICLIEGEHNENIDREEGDEKLNGSGKSSRIEAIVWCLFGNLTKKKNPGDIVVNWHKKKNCKVTIETADGYSITRFRKHENLNNEVLIFKNGEDVTKSITKPVQEYINDIFNIDYNIFIRSKIFAQSNCGFMELSEAKMRAVLEKMMGVDNINPIAKTAKGKSDGINQEIEILNSEIESINTQIKTAESRIEQYKLKDNCFKEQKEKEVNNLKQSLNEEKEDTALKISTIKKTIKEKEESNEKKIDIQELEEKWKVHEKSKFIEEKISQANQKIEKLEEALNKSTKETINITELKKKHELNKKIKQKIEEINKINEKLNSSNAVNELKINQETESLKNLNIGNCSKCKQEISEQYIESLKAESQKIIEQCTEIINNNEEKITKNNSIIKILKDKVNNSLLPLEEALSHNDEIKKENEHKSKCKCELNKLKSEVESYDHEFIPEPEITINEALAKNKLIAGTKESIKNLNDRIIEIKEEFKNFILDINDRSKKIENSVSPYLELISDESNSLRSLLENKELKIKDLNKKKTLKLHVDYIKDSYTNKRKIKAFWISELVPELNRYLKYYLDHFEVIDKVEFNELLIPKMDRWSYVTHSGGECRKIDLSMMFALNDLYIKNFGSQSNFMVLDEVDGKLDPFTINKIVSLLSDDIIKRDNDLNNIFVISHRKEMKDRFPHKIRVKNKEERAYIVNE